MNAFTAPEPAPCNSETFNHAAFHELEPGVPDARRYDGWTPEKQKRFLTALSRGHSVTQACAIVGMSRQSAYALRDSAHGAAFALGWKAAQLRARDCLADELMDRAFNGVRESVTTDDGRITTRHRHDNQLAWKMLDRLDRRADAACTDADAAAVRLAAADFEQFLDLVEQSAAPGRAGLFLAARLGAAGVAGEDDLAPIRTLARADRWLRTHVDVGQGVDIAGLDPARRSHWSGEQWAHAEAAGLVVIAAESPGPDLHIDDDEAEDAAGEAQLCQLRQPAGAQDDEGPVWWCDIADAWRTRFPPPPGFRGLQEGDPGCEFYERELTREEEAAMEAREAAERAPRIAAGLAERAQWLADCRAAADVAAMHAAPRSAAAEPPVAPPQPPHRPARRRGGALSLSSDNAPLLAAPSTDLSADPSADRLTDPSADRASPAQPPLPAAPPPLPDAAK